MATTVKLYNQEGKASGTVELDPAVFGVPVSQDLILEAVRIQQARRKQPVAHTKTRAEVRGGGRKPWRQKGTGRARHGSIRSPLWKGGGVTFGPRKTDMALPRMNVKARRKALRMVLSDKRAHDRIVAVDSLDAKEYKTKFFTDLVGKLPVERRVLLVLPTQQPKTVKSVANVPTIDAIRADSLNVIDLLQADYLVIARDSFAKISDVYGKN